MTAGTAQRILDTAQLLVQQRGYHAFSYADIAGAVGIRKASIHYYYPSKGDLAEALLARVRLDFEAALDDIEQSGAGIREQFIAFAGIFRQTLAEGDRLCPFCVLATAQDSVPDAVRSQVQAFWSRGEQWLAKLLGDSDKGISAKAQAELVVSALEGAMITARAFEEPDRMDTAIESLEALLFDESELKTRKRTPE